MRPCVNQELAIIRESKRAGNIRRTLATLELIVLLQLGLLRANRCFFLFALRSTQRKDLCVVRLVFSYECSV